MEKNKNNNNDDKAPAFSQNYQFKSPQGLEECQKFTKAIMPLVNLFFYIRSFGKEKYAQYNKNPKNLMRDLLVSSMGDFSLSAQEYLYSFVFKKIKKQEGYLFVSCMDSDLRGSLRVNDFFEMSLVLADGIFNLSLGLVFKSEIGGLAYKNIERAFEKLLQQNPQNNQQPLEPLESLLLESLKLGAQNA